jgi:hypothetical protein
MRILAVVAGLLCVAAVLADSAKDAGTSARYGITPDPKSYPQSTPKEALGSILKAVENKRVDYLLAHLADPEFVDRRVKENGGKFEDLVEETRRKLVDDPGPAKLFGRFLKEGDWEVEEADATVSLKDVRDRVIHFHKADGRWFMKNEYKPGPGK